MTGDKRVIEAKAIIGLARARAKDKKNITLHTNLPPLTDEECVRIHKEMFVKYKHIRNLAPRK